MVQDKEKKPEMVRIKLFRDNDRYKNDLFVSVNCQNFQIARGAEVEVPCCVAEVLENSARQDALTAQRMEQAAGRAL